MISNTRNVAAVAIVAGNSSEQLGILDTVRFDTVRTVFGADTAACKLSHYHNE